MKELRNRLVLFMLVFTFSVSLLAQNNKQILRGSVSDKLSLSPLIGVSIVVLCDNKTSYAFCDTLGNFKIEVPIGRCDVSVSYMGYKPDGMKNVMIYSGKETVVDFFLEESISSLDEIIIVARDKKIGTLNDMATTSSRILSPEEANRYAGSWNDPARMSSSFAGIVASNDSRNDIVVRGNSPIGIQWRLDGFEIYNPNHFGSMGGSGGNVGMINNNQLRNSEFYSGAFPAEFGNLTSGLFDLKLRNGNNQKREYIASIGFNGIELGAEGCFSKELKASYLINVRYSFLETLDQLGFEIAGTNGGVPKYWDISGKLNFPMKKSNLSIVFLPGQSKISFKEDMTNTPDWNPGDKGEDVDMKNKQYFLGANYTYRFTDRMRLENRFSYQSFDSYMNVDKISYMGENAEKYYNSKFKEVRFSYSSKHINKINSRNTLQSGIRVDYYLTSLKDSIFENDYPRLLHNNEDKKSVLFQGFTQWQFRFNDNLIFIPGAHATLYSLNKDWNIEPRLGLKWDINQKLSFGVGSGLYSQLQPRLVYYYQDYRELVNKNLKMTRSWQNAINSEYLIMPSFRFKVEAYYQYLYNVPVIKSIPEESILNQGDDYSNNWDYPFINKGIGYNYGLEFTLEIFFDKQFYFLFTASLYQSKYKGYDQVLRNTKFNGNYAFNLLGGYELKILKNSLLSFNGKISYIGNKRHTPTVSDDGVDMVIDYQKINSIKLPDYFRIDVNINMKNNFNRFSIEYFIEIDNLTNHKNVWREYYNINQNRKKYTYQQGFTPMGGGRLYF